MDNKLRRISDNKILSDKYFFPVLLNPSEQYIFMNSMTFLDFYEATNSCLKYVWIVIIESKVIYDC